MRWARLSEVVAAIEPRIDTSLVAGECLARVRSVAERIPASASSFFGFERRLGRDDSRIDFALGVSDPGARWIVSDRAWPVVAAIFERCADFVAAGSVRPWLEFDTSGPIDPRASPVVYVGFDPRQTDIPSTLALSQGLNDSARTSRRAIQRCLERFPPSVALVYLGAMQSRNVDGLRLSIEAMRLGDLGRYLREIGWPGDSAAVEAVLRRFDPPCERFCPQLDITSEIQARLGIELLSTPPAASEDANINIIRLLRLLVEERLCSPLECAELEDWPSRRSFAVPLVDRLIEAAHPRRSERLFHGSLVTALHHVKLSFEIDGSVQAKAYFGVILQDRLE